MKIITARIKIILQWDRERRACLVAPHNYALCVRTPAVSTLMIVATKAARGCRKIEARYKMSNTPNEQGYYLCLRSRDIYVNEGQNLPKRSSRDKNEIAYCSVEGAEEPAE